MLNCDILLKLMGWVESASTKLTDRVVRQRLILLLTLIHMQTFTAQLSQDCIFLVTNVIFVPQYLWGPLNNHMRLVLGKVHLQFRSPIQTISVFYRIILKSMERLNQLT